MSNNQKVDLVHKFKVIQRNKKQRIRQRSKNFMTILSMKKIAN